MTDEATECDFGKATFVLELTDSYAETQEDFFDRRKTYKFKAPNY